MKRTQLIGLFPSTSGQAGPSPSIPTGPWLTRPSLSAERSPAVAARGGKALILFAIGLGLTIPPAETGGDSLNDDDVFVRRDTVETRVTIGSVERQVLFGEMSPQFVGVSHRR